MAGYPLGLLLGRAVCVLVHDYVLRDAINRVWDVADNETCAVRRTVSKFGRLVVCADKQGREGKGRLLLTF